MSNNANSKDERSASAEAGCYEEHPAFAAKWPEGLEAGELYRIPCDDKGRNGGSWLEVLVAGDGDVHVMMQDWENIPDGEPKRQPTLRKRTGVGGGRHWRTRQALLWLAQAIRLDNEECSS